MIHEVQPDLSSKWTGRSILLSALTLATITIVALMGYLLFIRYSDIASSGDANLPIWIGNTWGNVAYFLISGAFMGLYLWVAFQGTPLIGAQSWRIGAVPGVSLGLLSLIIGVIANLITPTDPLGSGEQDVLLIAGLVACLLAGIWGTWQGKDIGVGIVAAFWCAFFQVLLIMLSTLVQDVLFADVLSRTIWSNDTITVCKYRHGLSYQSCEIGDNLGGAATLLVALPIIGAILGTISSAITALFTRQGERSNTLFRWRREGRAPLVFTITMIIVFLVEVIGKIW